MGNKETEFNKFLKKVKSVQNLKYDLIKKALYFSDEKHKGQKRLSGEDYVMHPLAVANILVDLHLDSDTVIAGLLHDVLEDTNTTEDEIKNQFNETILKLIKGVTKISFIKTNYKFVHEYENLRKFLFSIIDDVRVLMIKLADRLHNMRTLSAQPQPKQIEIAKNTLEIYAPLAARLGLEWMKNELEDLCLYYLDQKSYSYIKENVAMKKVEREKNINEIKENIKKLLNNEGIFKFAIKGRAKHFYSIYKKINEQNKTFEEIYDLYGIRIITEDIKECYSILGIIHSHYKPIPGRFKDYIAIPKSNFYQSLHTTCIDDKKRKLEIQIRTYEMDRIAEYGIAAHWMYKENITDFEKIQNEIKIFSKLREWNKDDFASSKLMENLKSDILQEDIFVFTPKGDVVELPKGSTVLDFAFAIHTDIGLSAIGGKINGKFVPLRKVLRNGDVVEILTSSKKVSSYDWIDIVKTRKAKVKLKSYFNKLITENKTQKVKVEKEIIKNIPPTIVINKNEVKQKVKEKKTPKEIYIMGEKNIVFEFAKCCNPEPGDKIIGVVSTKKRAIIVHKFDCPQIKNIEKNKNKIIHITWNDPFKKFTRKYRVISSGITTNIITDLLLTVDKINLILKCMKMEVKSEKIFCDLTLETKSEENFKLFEEILKKEKIKMDFFRIN